LKNLLLITNFYPPVNNIASLRPVSWAKFLKDDYNITILTRHFTGQEKTFADTLKPVLMDTTDTMENGVRVVRVPYNNTFYNWLVKSWMNKFAPTRGLIYFLNILIGRLLIQQRNNANYYKGLQPLLQKEKFDMILCTVSPMPLIELCCKVHKQYNIPFIIDIRDWFFFDEIKKDYKPSAKSSIALDIQKYYIHKRLKHAAGITAVNSYILEKLQHLHIPGAIIHNGFDDTADAVATAASANKEKFNFTVLGTLYPEQDIRFMVKGINLFLKQFELPPQALFNFIGTDNIENVSNIIKVGIPQPFLNITSRVPREQAMAYVANTDVLFHIGWLGYSGIYSGKIFEYLGMRKNILIAPNDKDVLEELLQFTGAGKLAETPEQMAAILRDWYNEWQAKGTIAYNGIEANITNFTRKNQAKKISAFINSLMPA
jgi:hypothetical protein